MNKVHFSSKKSKWETPQALFDKLNAEFGFTVDVCATKTNAKVPFFFSRKTNGLRQSWAGHRCWMNPPYGREIGKWIQKAVKASAEPSSALVVCLVPARTDTAWWHDNIWDEEENQPYPGVEVRLLRGRLKFGKAKSGAPFPSAIVIFRSWRVGEE